MGHISERRATIRKRDHFIGVWLDDTEYRHLEEQRAKSGLTASALIRKSILGVQLRPRPPDTYGALLRELNAIGVNINQIAHWANAREGVSAAEIQEVSALVARVWRLVKESL